MALHTYILLSVLHTDSFTIYKTLVSCHLIFSYNSPIIGLSSLLYVRGFKAQSLSEVTQLLIPHSLSNNLA